MYKKRTFREKAADDKDLPRVQRLSGAMEKRFGPGTILLPAVSEVESLMRKIPKGKVATINMLREILAKYHNATVACPMVTGIHARIAAGAAGEDEAEGKKRITPYWRTLKTNGELNPKYPGGIANQRRRLQEDGLTVIAKGKRYYVADHESHTANIR